MKITQITFNGRGKTRVCYPDSDTFVERIRNDFGKAEVERFREYIHLNIGQFGTHNRWPGTYERIDRLPFYLPAATIRTDKEGNEQLKRFGGGLALTVNGLYTEEERNAVKRRAATLPATLAAFTGSSGCSVKIIVLALPQGGAVPATIEEAERFCQAAYPTAAALYSVLLGHDAFPAVSAREGQLLYAGFRQPLDPQPYYHPEAVPLRIDPTDCRQTLPERAAAEGDGAGEADIPRMVQFLSQRYDFRFNTLTCVSEWRNRQVGHQGWKRLDDHCFNSLLIDLQSEGMRIWDKDLTRYLRSSKVQRYDPVFSYLSGLEGKWDGTDHIARLAATVPTATRQWERWFRTWFLGMVAQWMGRDTRYGNSVAPLLISRQGCNKSTFCRRLLPPQFRDCFIDNLNLEEKKGVLIAMAQSLLINLDEFNAIPAKTQQGFLKNVLQLPVVKVKMPYARSIETLPRKASFIATTNLTDILADPSGSRRFIGIELTGRIDTDAPIQYDQLYAQAVALLRRGERYWFDEEQTQEVIAHNRQFQQLLPAEQYFNECFELTDDERKGQYYTTAAIYEAVRQVAGPSLRVGGVSHFGQFLANLEGIVRKRSKAGTQYLLISRKILVK